MIATLLRISFLHLVRDRTALVLTFLLPLLFFSVFAMVFSGLDEGRTDRLTGVVVLKEETRRTERLKELLTAQTDFRWLDPPGRENSSDLPAMRNWIRSKAADVVVVIPDGFSDSLGKPGQDIPEIQLILNDANPLAGPLTEGALQAAALTLTIESFNQLSRAGETSPEFKELISIQRDRAMLGGGQRPSVAFFAAGIGVMFLLFSLSGRSAILVEEREQGVLTRLLGSELSLEGLLLGRWLFLSLLGMVQVTVMFVWAALAFGLDLWNPRHLAGFACMTSVTAASAAGFALMLAVSCRTRAQLNGISSVVILVMSAMGGSMFPRFLMSESMQAIGRYTFNAWALEGYQKIFWYGAPPGDLWPEIGVLGSACLVFLVIASGLARWNLRHGEPGA